MFNIGSGELVLIAVVALLVLGPKRLPELARGLGKFLREFRRQTDEVRNVVEREFYKMDKEMDAPPPSAPQLTAATDTIATQVPGAEAQVPLPLPDEEDHKLLAAPDPDPAVSHHTDPTSPALEPEVVPPAPAGAPVGSADPVPPAIEPAKKAG